MSNKGGRGNNTKTRFCYGACQKELPATEENFSKTMLKADKDGSDGWRRCESCKKARAAVVQPNDEDEYGVPAIDDPNVRLGAAPLQLGQSKLKGMKNILPRMTQAVLSVRPAPPGAPARPATSSSATSASDPSATIETSAIASSSTELSGAPSSAAKPVEPIAPVGAPVSTPRRSQRPTAPSEKRAALVAASPSLQLEAELRERITALEKELQGRKDAEAAAAAAAVAAAENAAEKAAAEAAAEEEAAKERTEAEAAAAAKLEAIISKRLADAASCNTAHAIGAPHVKAAICATFAHARADAIRRRDFGDAPPPPRGKLTVINFDAPTILERDGYFLVGARHVIVDWREFGQHAFWCKKCEAFSMHAAQHVPDADGLCRDAYTCTTNGSLGLTKLVGCGRGPCTVTSCRLQCTRSALHQDAMHSPAVLARLPPKLIGLYECDMPYVSGMEVHIARELTMRVESLYEESGTVYHTRAAPPVAVLALSR